MSHRFLGSVIGDQEGKDNFVRRSVNDWISQLVRLVKIAQSQPQAAYAKSLQNKWLYLQRLVPSCSHLFKDIENIITSNLLPTIFGCEISSNERSIFTLPTRMGGLNIQDPTEQGDLLYSTSRHITEIISQAIRGEVVFDHSQHVEHLLLTQTEYIKTKNNIYQDKFARVINYLDSSQRRAILRSKDEKMSSWLNVLPVSKHNFDLSSLEFRDALAIRYRKPLLNIPACCDGCGFTPFDLSHALSCRKGGLITLRHNEIRDSFGDLSALAWGQVIREPVVKESSDTSPALVADLAVRGVWVPQSEALFDVRVVDTDARSYENQTPIDILSQAEKEKNKKYLAACEERRAPLCVSVDGLLGREASRFLKRLGELLSLKWERSYSGIINWLRTRLSFAILRATIVCLRGSRTKWRSVNVVDGSPLDVIMLS